MTDPTIASTAGEAEAHRGYVRDIDQRVARLYGLGGMPFFVALLLLPTLAALFDLWTSALLWVPGLTAALLVLFVGRKAIYERRTRLRARVRAYGETNGLKMEAIAAYFVAQGEYSFFAALFEDEPRARGRLGTAEREQEKGA
ncbi:hypothetical protein [Lujinxingia litoralis]|nr:hypothetical protein [Lujinxingia litoralis]